MPLKCSFLTWNVASREPSNDLILDLARSFRVPASPVDVLIVGLEEIDMSFKSVVTGNSSNSDRWTEFLSMAKTLISDGQFDVVASHSMGGVYCAALIRQPIIPLLRDVEIWATKLGANGMLANKAAVMFRCTIGEASLASIACHLSPHDQNWEQRNGQWHELVSQLDGNIDYIIFMGDLNYRIDMTYEKCINLINSRNLAELIASDQLQRTRQTDPIIGTFMEAPIRFNPTFKFDKNSDVYDTSAKRRVPSWTDRVLVKTGTPRYRTGLEDSLSIETDINHHYMSHSSLFKTDCHSPMSRNDKANFPKQPHCICYRIIPNFFSDHRPVNAIYKFPIPLVVKERLDELNEVIAAKFDEARCFSTPALKLIAANLSCQPGQEGSIVLQNASLVWVPWKIVARPLGLEFTTHEGVLMAEERMTIGVRFPSKLPVEQLIVFAVAGGKPLEVMLGQVVGDAAAPAAPFIPAEADVVPPESEANAPESEVKAVEPFGETAAPPSPADVSDVAEGDEGK
jgi:hypothetical protein